MRMILLGSILLLVAGCTAERSARALFADVAGEDAEFCGMVRLQQDAAPATACVERALRSQTPFYVGIQMHGMDSQIWHGFARPRAGEVIGLAYDSDVNGGDLPLLRSPRSDQHSCPQPHIDRDRFGILARCY